MRGLTAAALPLMRIAPLLLLLGCASAPQGEGSATPAAGPTWIAGLPWVDGCGPARTATISIRA